MIVGLTHTAQSTIRLDLSIGRVIDYLSPAQLPSYGGQDKTHTCKLIAQQWMDVEHLPRVLEYEHDPNEASFSNDLPHRYMEVARMILSVCGSDSGDSSYSNSSSDEIPNIQTVRMDKIRRNVHTLSHQTLSRESHVPVIDMTGIGSLETVTMRPFLQRAFRDHTLISNVLLNATSNNGNERSSINSIFTKDWTKIYIV